MANSERAAENSPSCSSSSYDEYDIYSTDEKNHNEHHAEENVEISGKEPYQFEPYLSDSEDDFSAEESDNLDNKNNFIRKNSILTPKPYSTNINRFSV